jgi:hypothetical protein
MLLAASSTCAPDIKKSEDNHEPYFLRDWADIKTHLEQRIFNPKHHKPSFRFISVILGTASQPSSRNRGQILLDEIKYVDFWRSLLKFYIIWDFGGRRNIPQDPFGPSQDQPGYEAQLVGWVDDIKIDHRGRQTSGRKI